ncbi:uncharacterized protein PHALS_12980 [Plasmopara halstedii]|uniref:Uncharacterized protein n=1 Tax=Plasmopara halstedii TaxID=4781 RepID=A0A0P1ANY6_PLAHL|nr:uncharacterized protein PHALS_12980 [Plasmopara halstedii]CEG42728.1 hypothetical protein PHALS_12980 [Plasmopara halstedii]|eukprot:XP_024579097.1 hypothetical protein PHALS_12980 [Plasmopara halstedii]
MRTQPQDTVCDQIFNRQLADCGQNQVTFITTTALKPIQKAVKAAVFVALSIQKICCA